ncbi:MAG: tRNA pseudouridine(55) synthase TruB [Deltaproteobacteria bacterium]|nr:tRNA pseudouridine(55) synthase TruB [Deltaproteobacteria bacterium]
MPFDPSGLLILDKTSGPTSHDLCRKVRRLYGTRKVGHTGTLDPFATGVMVVLLGKATRLARYFNDDAKEYVADVAWGSATDTADRDGAVTERTDVPLPDEVAIREAMAKFVGFIDQIPPMYSAKKVQGQKLHQLARRGEKIDREPVRVRIDELELLSRTDAGFRLRVACSKGTYIRTLAEDLCRALGGLGHLASLRRTRAGRFTIDAARDVAELEEAAEEAWNDTGIAEARERVLTDALMPMLDALAHLPAIVLPDALAEGVAFGKRPPRERLPERAATLTGDVRLLDSNGRFLATGRVGTGDTEVELVRVLVTPDGETT